MLFHARYRLAAEVTVPSADQHASAILRAYEEAQAGLLGKAVVLTDGKAGTIEKVWLARISHRVRRIGAPNQRKFFCEKDFGMIRGAPDADRV